MFVRTAGTGALAGARTRPVRVFLAPSGVAGQIRSTRDTSARTAGPPAHRSQGHRSPAVRNPQRAAGLLQNPHALSGLRPLLERADVVPERPFATVQGQARHRRLLSVRLHRPPGPLGRLPLLRPDGRDLPDLLPDPGRPGSLPGSSSGFAGLGPLGPARSGAQGARCRQAHLCPVRPVSPTGRPSGSRYLLLPPDHLGAARRAACQRHAQGGSPGHDLALLRRHSPLPLDRAAPGNARGLVSEHAPRPLHPDLRPPRDFHAPVDTRFLPAADLRLQVEDPARTAAIARSSARPRAAALSTGHSIWSYPGSLSRSSSPPSTRA